MSYINKTLRIGAHWISREYAKKGPTVLEIINNQVDEITVLRMPINFFAELSQCLFSALNNQTLTGQGWRLSMGSVTRTFPHQG